MEVTKIKIQCTNFNVEHSRKRLRPKMAIESFCDCYGDYLKVIHQEYRLALKKIKE